MQNVVTYTVVATAENHDLVLLPGMTAIVRIVTTEHRNVLLIPSSALRLRLEEAGSKASGQAESPDDTSRGRVWVRNHSDRLSPVDIRVGKSSGSMTEVVSGPLSEGQAVAVGKRFRHREQRLFGIRLGF